MQHTSSTIPTIPPYNCNNCYFLVKNLAPTLIDSPQMPPYYKIPTMLPIIKLQKRFHQRMINIIWQCIAMWGSWGLSLSGESEPPDPWECEETRRQFPGRHTPPSGHCQGDKHETAETEEGAAFSRVPYLICFFPGGAHSRSGNEAKDAKTGGSRDFEAVLEQ